MTSKNFYKKQENLSTDAGKFFSKYFLRSFVNNIILVPPKKI
jgi:hypothetical protein